jgi:mannose-6-phosphate isomerase-like protein (cupin superfamily)
MNIITKHLSQIVPERGSCGTRKRLIDSQECDVVGLSYVAISDARAHLHRTSWEVYYVLAGEGSIEVGEEVINVASGSTVLIPPGTRHCARSSMGLEVLVIMVPPMAEAGDIVYVDEQK